MANILTEKVLEGTFKQNSEIVCMQRVLGYYMEWNERLPPERIDYRLFTHLCHAFAEMKKDGSVETLPRAKMLCERAKAKGVKVLLSLGGADSNKILSTITEDKTAFTKLLDNLMMQVEKVGYAGIDVDWEGQESPAERDKTSLLVMRLRERLGKEHLLTMAAPSSNWGGQWFDLPTLLPHIDWLNVMNYDYHGPWGDTAGHNANLYPYPGDGGISDVGSVDYWIKNKGLPLDKYLLGIPCYGRGFVAKKMGDKADKTKPAPHQEIQWHEVDALLRMGWKRQYDSIAHVPYIVSPRGDEIISYEDFDSAQEKGAWAKQQKLGGIFFWEISQDFTDGTNLIVRGARRGFI